MSSTPSSDLKANRGHGVIIAGSAAARGGSHARPPDERARSATSGQHRCSDPRPWRGPWRTRRSVTRLKHGESIAARRGQGRDARHLGGNPVYDAPADLDFAAKSSARSQVVDPLGDTDDETSARAPGTSTARTTSRRGATAAPGTARSASASRSSCRSSAGGAPSSCSRSSRATSWRRGRLSSGARSTRCVGGADERRRWRQTLHDGFLAGQRRTLEATACDRVDAHGGGGSAGRVGCSAARRGCELVFAPRPVALRRPLRQQRLAAGSCPTR